MNKKSKPPNLVSIGNIGRQGSYVLRMIATQSLAIRFGRFKDGKLINVQPGEYAYIGSAMAQRGATCLARRLVRHATRSGQKRPHAIRATMLKEFPVWGLADDNLSAPESKSLRWNVDHLLDRTTVELQSAYAVRSPWRIENKIGDLLEGDPCTVVFEKGLGANDRPGSTYLLRVEADERWWHELTDRLELCRAMATA